MTDDNEMRRIIGARMNAYMDRAMLGFDDPLPAPPNINPLENLQGVRAMLEEMIKPVQHAYFTGIDVFDQLLGMLTAAGFMVLPDTDELDGFRYLIIHPDQKPDEPIDHWYLSKFIQDENVYKCRMAENKLLTRQEPRP